MQKKVFNSVKKAVYSILGAGLVFTFCSCQDPIFYHINQEVKLEEASIFGDIYEIARYNHGGEERLYFANGYIYYKAVDADGYGKWHKCSKPSGHVLSVAADSNALYALVFGSERNDLRGEMQISEKNIYKSTDGGATWSLNTANGLSDKVAALSKGNSVEIMSTNAINNSNRKAYIVIKETAYNLSDGIAVTAGNGAHSCAYADGVYFSDSASACSDESSTNPASKVFGSVGSKICIYNSSGTVIEEFMTSVGVIYGIAVFDNGNEVLVTSSSGSALYRKTGSSWNEVQYANLTSTVSSLYEGYYTIAADPSKSALETAAYAAIAVVGNGSNSAQFTHEGLWAYYPARGKWNIE